MKLLLLLALAQTCLLFSADWGPAYQWGKLDTNFLDEQSGMAISKKFTDRLYHINDSGGGPFFYLTDLKGQNTQKVEVRNWYPIDVEDMVLGAYQGKECLFLADTGDNDEDRESVHFAIIEEVQNFEKKITPIKVFSIKYPDQPHNTEASVIDPSGNLYVVTKEMSGPSKIYKLSKSELESPSKSKTFQYFDEIDVSKYLNSSDSLVTSAALSKDGKTLLLLTYTDILQVQVDFSAKLEIFNFRTIKLQNLYQQESVALMPDEKGFLYSTESHKGSAKIWRVDRK